MLVKVNSVESSHLSFFNPFPPTVGRLAKPLPPLLFYCLMADNFSCQETASGWETVNWSYLPRVVIDKDVRVVIDIDIRVVIDKGTSNINFCLI